MATASAATLDVEAVLARRDRPDREPAVGSDAGLKGPLHGGRRVVAFAATATSALLRDGTRIGDAPEPHLHAGGRLAVETDDAVELTEQLVGQREVVAQGHALGQEEIGGLAFLLRNEARDRTATVAAESARGDHREVATCRQTGDLVLAGREVDAVEVTRFVARVRQHDDGAGAPSE